MRSEPIEALVDRDVPAVSSPEQVVKHGEPSRLGTAAVRRTSGEQSAVRLQAHVVVDVQYPSDSGGDRAFGFRVGRWQKAGATAQCGPAEPCVPYLPIEVDELDAGFVEETAQVTCSSSST